jgi:cobalt-zinc-cadmium efflux system outer membrane protein
MNSRSGFAVLTIVGLFSALAAAQQTEKKSYTLRGTVEQVNTTTKRLSVANEPIPGGMGAMTMNYAVDKEDVLGRVKPGDHITAKMYEGDMTLYDIQVLPTTPVAPQAAAQPGLRLEDLEQMALANNPTVAQAQANIRVFAGRARQAGLYPNPTVGYYGDEIRGGYDGGGKQGGFISQTIVTGGKLRAARRVAELFTKEAETSGEVQRLRILNNVRSLFYQVLADQRLVEVRQNLAKLSADATQTSHQLANVGQADRPDVLQAEVEQQQINVSLRIAQQTLRSSWRTLAAVTGKPDLPQTRLEGDLEAIPDLNYEEWLATTLRESPVVKLAQQAADRAEASLTQAKKVPIPDLQLYGNLSQNNQPLMDTSPRITGVNGGVQIGVQLPIFNRNQGNIAAAKAEIESAKSDLVRVRLQIARDVANLFRDYDSARATVQQYKNEMLPRAEQAYKLYQANYQNMAAAYPQTLISQRTLFQLEVDYVQALESAWQTALGIRGFGLMDGLAAPSGSSGGGGPQPMVNGYPSGNASGSASGTQASAQ